MARRTEPNYTRAAKAYLREIKRAERAAKECGVTSLEGRRAADYAARLRACLIESVPAKDIPA